MKEDSKKEKRYLRKIFKWLLIAAVIFTALGTVLAVGGYLYISKGLPKISSLEDYHPPIITTVFSDDGKKIGELYIERRKVIPLSEIPEMLIKAFIAAEDDRFYEHTGVDIFSIARAFFKNIEAGTIVQGGSTITQQVAKSFLLTPERKYIRKIKEAILAYRIEKRFSKNYILYLYLNQIYLGHGAYGVEAAAENYFGKRAKDLSIAECALLAGLTQAPARYSPKRSPETAKQRRFYVLKRMSEEGYIDSATAAKANNEEIDVHERRNWYMEEVPIYTEYVRREIERKYGKTGVNGLYTGGLQVYTAVNTDMQLIARNEVEKGLLELDKRQGYRGPIKHIESNEDIEKFSRRMRERLEIYPLVPEKIIEGVVIGINDISVTVRIGDERGMITLEDMKWARKPNPDLLPEQDFVKNPAEVMRVGDVIQVQAKSKDQNTGFWEFSLQQQPITQAALLCIESKTGHVKAMIGGKDFNESQFNRAVQSRRQPGSAFKPVIYSAAIDKGYTAATEIIDSPIIFEDKERDFVWKPKNYGKRFHGPTLLREALAKSRNVITVKILQDIGIDYAIEYARKLGIVSELSNNLSIALGSSGVSLLELANAYAVFMNNGILVEPVFITKIVDRNGEILEKAGRNSKKVIDITTAYIITSLLESVVKEGTGWRVKELGKPVAGKTGTTNNLYDAWFLGYTPRYVTGVWVGFDEERSLGEGETGSRAASPIWLGFMKQILEGKPSMVFRVPKGIIFCRIDAETGLLPVPESEKTRFECFKEGTAPTQYTKKSDLITEPEEFYKDI